jgi:Uma2 family endonuclease
VAAFSRPHYSFREYVAIAESANIKLEYVDGEICAMAGGSPEHAAISANIGASLLGQLRGKGCRVHSSDLRIRVPATGLAAYPDVSVVCGSIESDPEERSTVTNPKVVIEVLSPSTEDYDRGEKLAHYKQLASLGAIVLVAWDRRELEVWDRAAESRWERRVVSQGIIELRAISCTLDVDGVYRDELGGSLVARA